jgi:hypothetical protein
MEKAFGTWPSPITAEAVATQGIRLSHVFVDGDDIYWIEGRAQEAGRYVLVRVGLMGRWRTSRLQASTFGRASTSTVVVRVLSQEV